METGTGLAESILAMTPPGTACAVRGTDREHAPLWPAELPAAAGMGTKRLREFSAGRHCARQALSSLGHAPVALPVGPGRAPAWPEGIIGSISHTDELAIAVVARQAELRSLGIDLESADPLAADLLGLVCRDEERAALAAGGLEVQHGAKLVFSAKESIYKCLWPLTSVFLEFQAIGIRLDAAEQRFSAYGQDPRIAGIAEMIRGRYGWVGGLLFSCAWLDRDSQRSG